jgi:hypothetical protein
MSSQIRIFISNLIFHVGDAVPGVLRAAGTVAPTV